MALKYTPPKTRRVSIATQVQASIGHKSVKQVYAQRKEAKRIAALPLSGTEQGLAVNQPRLKVQTKKGGWSKVTYTDPNAKSPITFNIRTSGIKDVMYKEPNAWFHPAEAVYSRWINTTVQGQLYSARRQVEGMLKVAVRTGDTEMARKLEQILAMDDVTVAKFRKDWEDAHSDVEIEEYYTYEDETEIVW